MKVHFTKTAPKTYTTTLKDSKGPCFVAIKSVDGLFFVYLKREGAPAQQMGYFHFLRDAKAAVQRVHDKVSA